MNRVLFLDLDGTIIETKSGKTFPTDIDDWKFKSGILPKIKEYTDLDYHIFIVTNQGGVNLGHVTPLEIESKLELIVDNILRYVGSDKKIVYRILMYDENRKPNPGVGESYISYVNANKEECLMVGDASSLETSFSDSDRKFAENLGIEYKDINEFLK